jgi:mobilome CxxCx(11)CxxC protein
MAMQLLLMFVKPYNLHTYMTLQERDDIRGAIVMGYGSDGQVTKYALIFGTPAAIIQLVLALLATTQGWSNELAYSSESKTANYDLFRSFEDFAKRPSDDDQNFNLQFTTLKAIEQSREQQDSNHPTSEKENRQGMRYALKHFQRTCVTCGQMPTSMTPTDCDTCGKF